MALSRREFVQTGGAALLGFTLFRAGAALGQHRKVAEVPLLWLSAASCDGCTASLLGGASPRIEDALLGELLPGKHLSLTFQTRLMVASGQHAMAHLEKAAADNRGKYLLVVEGAIPTKDEGRYCQLGECADGRVAYAAPTVIDLARHAKAVLCVGTCASFGGLSAAAPNPSGAVGVGPLLRRAGVTTKVVNIPGCPPNPDWIVGTLSALVLGGEVPQDKLGRPKAFYSTLVHDQCAYRGDFDRGRFAEHFGQQGCLFKLGCKGQVTFADCPVRHSSSTQGGCIGAGHPCIGCTRSDFPFAKSLFARVEPSQLGFPALFPEPAPANASEAGVGQYVAIGLLGVGGFAAGLGVSAVAHRLQKLQAEDAVEQSPAQLPTEGGTRESAQAGAGSHESSPVAKKARGGRPERSGAKKGEDDASA